MIIDSAARQDLDALRTESRVIIAGGGAVTTSVLGDCGFTGGGGAGGP